MSETKIGVRVRTNRYDFDGRGEKEVIVFRTETPDQVAQLAIELLERWGLVAAMPDGEDSAGRAKLRLPTADELVTRAFDIAERTVATARARGHMVDVPDLNAINEESDAERAKKQAERAA